MSLETMRVRVTRPDEIGELGRAFNEMAERRRQNGPASAGKFFGVFDPANRRPRRHCVKRPC
jgi:hypothetical protein